MSSATYCLHGDFRVQKKVAEPRRHLVQLLFLGLPLTAKKKKKMLEVEGYKENPKIKGFMMKQ